MDGHDFDDLVKRLSQARLTRLEALRGLLASTAVGLTSATLTDETEAKKHGKAAGKKSGNHKKSNAGKKKHHDKQARGEAQEKVLLCHKGQTLEVAEPAVSAHLGHGDSLGPCGGSTSTTVRPGPGEPGPGGCAGVVDGPDPSGQCSWCCQGGCCSLPANQCNLAAGLCCAPNCANRECGPDGCGRGGTCGCGAGGTCTRGAVCPPGQVCTCPSGRDCNPVSGQCPGPPATTTTTTVAPTTTTPAVTTTTTGPCQGPQCVCQAGGTACDYFTDTGSSCSDGCPCAARVQGGNVCWNGSVVGCLAGGPICTNDTQCGPGGMCVRKGSCSELDQYCFGDATVGVCVNGGSC